MQIPNILFILPLPPPVHGSSMMSRYIEESSYVREAVDGHFINLSTSRRMDEIGKHSVRKIGRFLGAYLLVIWKLMTVKYDACYLAITCHGLGFLKDAPFVLLCKLFGKKIVIHQHNKGMSKDVKRWPYRWLMPLVYRDATVILLSERLYPDIRQVVRREQVLICPNGIPTAETEKRNKTRSENKKPKILFLSNLLIEKGVFVLLDACKLLKEKGVDFSCTFVGGETKEIGRKEFEAEIDQRGLSAVVEYAGRKYDEEKEAYWCDSDFFVLPTSNETFGLVLVEAMQHRLPCVTTDEGGIPDIVVDGVTGFITQRKNPVSLAEALELLIRDEALRKGFGEAGYRRYKELFTKEVFEKRMVECLMKISANG